MPINNDVAIESALKPKLKSLSFFIGTIVLVGILLIIFFRQRAQSCPISFNNNGQIVCVELETVSSSEARSIGLAKYDNLADSRGMLFVFDKPEMACMWMKGMKFSIDILWLNDKKEIVKIAENVEPETYPTITFCSEEPVRYVIELNENTALKANLEIGQRINF